jgi:hypothetical protein
MTRTTYTPGPWACTTRQGSWDWVVYKADDPNIEICQLFHDGTEFNDLGEANANLISAAPDLYATAAHLLDMIDAQERERTPTPKRESNDDANSRDERDQVFGDAVERLRAALAKARGES